MAGNYTILDGNGQVDPIKGMLLSKAKVGVASGDTIDDLLTVALEDRNTTDTIASAMSKFDHYFDLARQYAATGLGLSVVLHAEPVAGDVWESQILDGWTEFASKGTQVEARLAGSMSLTLHITRQNWWQAPEAQLNTSSPAGNDYLTGSTMALQPDISGGGGMHTNAVIIPTYSGGPDLPSPLRFEIKFLTAGNQMGDLFMSQNVNSETVGRVYVLDDVTATGGANHNDATAYKGAYKDCSFSGGNVLTDMLNWALDAGCMADCKGNWFRFILRFGAVMNYMDLEMQVQVRLHGTSAVVGKTDWMLATPGNWLQVFDAMRLPPFDLGTPANAGALDLVLVVQRATVGSYSIGVDYLQMVPLDGWRHYQTLYALPTNWTLIDNGARGIVSSLDATGHEVVTHIADGQSFMLAPAVTNGFYFAWMNVAGGAVVTDSIRVKAFVCARRRLL